MKKASLAAVATLLLAGCGAMPVSPTAKLPRRYVELPTVEFCCDEISAGLVAAANTSYWACDDCQSQATSASALTGFSAILAKNPDVVVITVGTWDLATGIEVPFPAVKAKVIGSNYVCSPVDEELCVNLTNMVNQAQAAGIKVILGTLPPFGNGPLATQITAQSASGCCAYQQAEWNFHLYTGYFGTTPLVDFSGVLSAEKQTYGPDSDGITDPYNASYSDDGINPNAAGYAVMLPITHAAITEAMK